MILKFALLWNKMSISGIRDLDREILGKVDDAELLKVCSIDKYTWNIVCDDDFLKRRLLAKYPQIEKYKLNMESWKEFFLRVSTCIYRMKKKYGYEYKFGNVWLQINLFKQYAFNKDELLIESAEYGDLALIEWCLKNGAVINARNNWALRRACNKGRLEVVKYLVEHGADIHDRSDDAFINACMGANLEVVKYLVELGANIHAQDGEAFILGSQEIVKYLETKI
jgi:hypothetical protein